jgi:pre-mRNA-splicing factor 18
VIRRLRALGQPVTLFGEEDADRQARLVKVEKTVALVDETRGGGENVMLMLKRQEKAKAKQAGGDKAAAADKAASSKAAAASAGGAGEGPAKPGMASEGGAAAAADAGAGSSSGAGGTAGSSDADALMESFKAAAARLAEQRADDALDVEDKMIKMIKEWCVEWEADLEARPEDVSFKQLRLSSLAGTHAHTQLMCSPCAAAHELLRGAAASSAPQGPEAQLQSGSVALMQLL